MRRLCAILVVTVALSAAAAGPAQAHVHTWRPGVRSALRYAHERRGQIAFAVRIGSHLYGNAAERAFPSASVLKAMLMVAYLRRPSVRERRLRSGDMALLAPMIRRSDNTAASRVDSIVGNEGLRRLARRVGMRRFRPAAPIWGNSLIDATDQTRFFLHIDSFVPRRHRASALRLLASIVPSQRWGIGQARPRGWALYFKGGWGSGTGRVDHQVALLRHGHKRIAVAILSENDGTHAYGKETLRGVAARLLHGLGPRSRLG